MLERWGWFVVRHCRAILAICAVLAVVSVWCYATLPDKLSNELLVVPGSETHRGEEILQRDFGVGVPNLVLLVTADGGSVDEPEVGAEAQALVGRLSVEPGVKNVVSYWTHGRSPQLRSTKGDRALVVGRVLGDDKEKLDRVGELVDAYERPGERIDVRVGGSSDALREMLDISTEQIHQAEVVTGPITLVALLFVFGSMAAALLPLLVAAGAVLGSACVLWVAAELWSISSFASLLTTAVALGLGIDYSLFIVSRFREELAAGHPPDLAVVRTVRTAGRTVLFSASAVMVALAATLIMPLNFLRSFGGGAMITAVMAGVGALIILPAVLAAIGPGVNRWTVWQRSATPVGGAGIWFRTATVVMRRPLLVAGSIIAILLVFASPIRLLDVGMFDDRELPVGSRSRTTGEILRTEFNAEGAVPLAIVLPGTDAAARAADVDRFAAQVAALPHVQAVVASTGSYTSAGRVALPAEAAAAFVAKGSTYLSLVSDVPPLSDESDALVESLRALPHGFPELLVSGDAANLHDITESVLGAMPLALLFVVLATGLILFLQFGSVLVPLKAILLNVLSMGAIMGVFVWVFQEGHLSGLLDFTATGSIYVNMPVFMFFLAFGLSMDYEVFLLSRIKEEYDLTGDNDRAVALGLERSGRIVSAAAVLISIVFFTVGLTGSMTSAKMFGFGIAAVVLLDAFVIRGTLVPAFMRLAGGANWWAPAPLRRLHDRIGISEHVDLDEPEPARV